MRTELLTLSDEEFVRLRTLIHQRFGIYLADGKKLLVQGRLNKELRSQGYESFAAYVDDLEKGADADKLLTLVDRISTNHSFFFREEDHFDFLAESILPELVNDGVRPDELRMWSAGAADGREAYTVALVLRDFFGASVVWRRPVVLATDISVSSLRTAVDGVYPLEALDTVPAKYHKFFTRVAGARNGRGERVRLSDRIREMVMFKRLNLNQPSYPFKNRFHVIFCRNVMIYFDRETREKMAHRLCTYTLPKGYLLIGHSESLGRSAAGYAYVRPTVYRKWR